MGRDRWKLAPAGGEFSYYTQHDQKQALAADGPHGISFEKAAADFHITFMIGDGQPRYQPMDRIRAAGMACGYKFRVLAFEASPTRSRVTVTNTGVAPIYHDAFVAVNGVGPHSRSRGCSRANRGLTRSAPAATHPGSRSRATASCRGRRSSSRPISCQLRGRRRSSGVGAH